MSSWGPIGEAESRKVYYQMTLQFGGASEIPSGMLGVKAWISDLSICPIGLTVVVSAQLSGRRIQSYPSAVYYQSMKVRTLKRVNRLLSLPGGRTPGSYT